VKRAVAILLLASWAWALVLAGMPELHAWAHDLNHADCAEHEHSDGDKEEDHACAATLIATGAFTFSLAAPTHTGEQIIFAVIEWPWRSNDVVLLVLVGEPLERGPPVFAV
jgi:hypothetical protein